MVGLLGFGAEPCFCDDARNLVSKLDIVHAKLAIAVAGWDALDPGGTEGSLGNVLFSAIQSCAISVLRSIFVLLEHKQVFLMHRVSFEVAARLLHVYLCH